MKRLIVLLGIQGVLYAANAQQVNKSVLFANAQYVISPFYASMLDSFAAIACSGSTYQISIYGFTDSIGTEAANHELAVCRTEAVADYLVSKGLKKEYISMRPIGEAMPKASNTFEQSRRYNRRVDLKLTYTIAPEVAEKKKPAEEPKPVAVEVADTAKWPYVREGKGGTIVRITDCTFSPYKAEEVDIRIVEVADKEAMLATQTTTVDVNGMPLVSGGMVYIRCYVKGKEVKPNKNCGMEVSMPADDTYDEGMMLYTSTDPSRRDADWKLQRVKPQRTVRNGKTYYTFTPSSSGGMNMDKPVCPQFAGRRNGTRGSYRDASSITVRIKGMEGFFQRKDLNILVAFNNQRTLLKGKRTGRNTYRFNCACMHYSEFFKASLVISGKPDEKLILRSDFQPDKYSVFRKTFTFGPYDFKQGEIASNK